MKIVNPNFVSASPVTAADKTMLTNYLVAHADAQFIAFDELRAALPAGQRPRATDGLLQQAAVDLGLKVVS